MKKKHPDPDAPREPHQEGAIPPAAPPTPATPSAPAPAADPRDAEIARLLAREDELLRAMAELQNVTRRRRQETESALRFASEPLLRQLLPVLDDFERALAAFPDAEDPLRRGVALVHERLVKMLEREGLEAIRPLGEPFDPELHDAIAHHPAPGVAPGTVVEVATPGYRYRDRVLRHAKVVVAADTPVDAAAPGSAGGPSGNGGAA